MNARSNSQRQSQTADELLPDNRDRDLSSGITGIQESRKRKEQPTSIPPLLPATKTARQISLSSAATDATNSAEPDQTKMDQEIANHFLGNILIDILIVQVFLCIICLNCDN